jgi:Flp pilus assembly protein TadG
VIEGTAGLVVAFLLLTLLVQVAGAALARHAAEAAVNAAARRAARPGALASAEEEHLTADLATALPGAVAVRVGIDIEPRWVVASARFRWRPPGPDWLPLTIAVQASAPRMVPP